MNEKMKVTFVAYTSGLYKEADRWLKQITEILQNNKIEPRVIFLSFSNQPCPIVDMLRLKGIDCKVLPLQKYGESDIINILGELKKNPPDVFIPNLSVAAFFAVKWLKKAGIPSVGIIRNDNQFHCELIDYFIDGLDQFKVDAVVCESQYLYDILVERIDEKQNLLQCTTGVPLTNIYAEAPKEKIKIVYIGRVAQDQKRVFELVDSFYKACIQNHDIEVIIYAYDQEQEKLFKKVKKFATEVSVSYGGILAESQVYSKFVENHIFALLSDDEGTVTALVEAMACGVVPICLKTDTKMELIEDGVNGLLVDDKQESFYNAIRRLKNEDGLWERLSKAAIKTVESGHSTRVVAEKWSKLITSLYVESAKNIIEIPQLAYMNLPTARTNKIGIYRDFKTVQHNKTYQYIRSRLKKIHKDKIVVLYGAGQFAVEHIKLYASLKPNIKFVIESYGIKNADIFRQYDIDAIDLKSFKRYFEKNFSNKLVVFIVTVQHKNAYQSIYEYIQHECTSFENEVIWAFKKPDNTVTKTDNFIDIELTKNNMGIYHTRKSIKLFLDEHINKYRGIFLDFGCGRMPYREYILQNAKIEKYIGIDIENHIYQQESRPDIFWDGNRIPLSDDSVDTVMATEVFEHVADIKNALSEIYRVLKPEGVLYFTVPYLWPLHDVPHDEYRYTPFSLERHLGVAGFSNTVIKSTGGWNAALAQMLGLWIAQLKDFDEKVFRIEDFFSFYKTLLKTDKIDNTFENNTMITGLSGIAYKE